MIHQEERNKLIKVRVDYQGSGQWQLRPEFTKGGNRVSKGKHIFRGDDEAFRKFLVKCKAAETDTAPASKRTKRYADIVQDMKANKATYIWMYTNRWSATNGITQIGERGMKPETKQLLTENIDTACKQVIRQLDSFGFEVSYQSKQYDFVIGGDEDFTSTAKHFTVEDQAWRGGLVVQVVHSSLDNMYSYYIYSPQSVPFGGVPDAGDAIVEGAGENNYNSVNDMAVDIIEDLEDYGENLMEGTNTEKTVVIQEDLQLPGTDIVLEAGDRIQVIEVYDSRNPEEKRAYELMIRAAEDAGIEDPDSELVWWDGETLMYDGMSIYPREELRFRARQAWKEYQGYTW